MLTDPIKTQIDAWISKYPADQKQSAVMPALRIVQESYQGYLSDEAIAAVAQYLEMPKIAVQEVATFYSMYELSPVGQHVFKICDGISCYLCGYKKISEHIQQKFNIKVGETTKDGKFTLQHVECLGACIDAPAMQLGNDYHEKLTPEKLDKIIEALP